ncbi:hypothetical protein M433DRAFT_158797 [Acidomyces richmondensis BFW]|nr:MAG: hypothetical protein FE78DRAFT_85759 [Acidomyces sp. 'richmondensis']KYG41633.1 hypothetical protein M433DRAFT_158797 [Acidomyces richmondensis BFW]
MKSLLIQRSTTQLAAVPVSTHLLASLLPIRYLKLLYFYCMFSPPVTSENLTPIKIIIRPVIACGGKKLPRILEALAYQLMVIVRLIQADMVFCRLIFLFFYKK